MRNLRWDESGEHLAVLTEDDRMWVLEVEPRRRESGPLWNRLVQEWEKRTGRVWWRRF